MGFPLLIEPAENRIDDSIHAFHVRKHDHGSCSSADFNEATFDRVGGQQLPPQVSREVQEVQQFRQIALQLTDHRRVALLPVKAEPFKGPPRARQIRCQVDLLRLGLLNLDDNVPFSPR